MKYELNEAEVFFIEKKLTELGLEYLPLKEEFLDHVCCMVENKISTGQTFTEATQATFEAIGKDELKELQLQTIFLTNQRSRRMKNAMLIFSCSIFFATGLFFFLKNENALTAIQPPSPKEVAAHSKDFFSNKNSTVCHELFAKEENANTLLSTFHDPPNICPLEGKNHLTSNYGMRFHPVMKKKKFHRGMDFKAPIGTPVLATAKGTVTKVKSHKNGYGKHIVIQHDDQFETLYAHLDEIKIAVGQTIQKGDIIGSVGNSGMSFEPHLHYEVIKDGKRVDPIAYCNP